MGVVSDGLKIRVRRPRRFREKKDEARKGGSTTGKARQRWRPPRWIPNARLASQLVFAALSLWLGFRFFRFVSLLESGAEVVNPDLRSPGIEAYLPITGLVGLKHWLLTGVLNPIHPAATLFFVGALITGLFLKKGFCGWICPIGLISESLRNLGFRLWPKGRKLRVPPLLDYPLRSIKYLLLAFFLWAILVQMDPRAITAFVYSPYNRVADIKMLKFFTDMSANTARVLLVLLVLSVLVPNFWCRYLCPYGALLGLLSWLSPVKVTRDTERCIDCGLCAKACPMNLPVDRLVRVRSDECNGCMECVAVCPVPRTLEVRVGRRGPALRPSLFAAMVIAAFFALPLWGKLSGHWRTAITVEEYREHVKHLDLPVYQHNQGRVPASFSQEGFGGKR